ncbi:hypothetical protein ACFQ36_08670 [Arthrobacter sp. GCM10027362]|uniref:hypothetical protein n=1 Tax=Arthrobacter sp. GCM10027362 TaxID=3273379 RepID=UPI0036286A64
MSDFYHRNGRLPSCTSSDLAELNLNMFLNTTLRTGFREGTLGPATTRIAVTIPGVLDTIEKADPKPERPLKRGERFNRWLTRAEEFTAANGYRPPYAENDLYQWLLRAGKKLDAGQLDAATADRVTAVLAYPNIRQYREQQR